MTAAIRLLCLVLLALTILVSQAQETAEADSYVKSSCNPGAHAVPNDSADTDVAPDKFYVEWAITATDNSTIVLEVVREWSPNGVDRFYKLVQDNYYNCAAFFRVVPDFVVQFGIASDPEQTDKWETTISDDPVLQSNLNGYVSFATSGPDTRTSQIFINTADNDSLDGQGFSPFAKVIQGMDIVETMLYNPTPFDSGGADQTSLSNMGNAWLLQTLPDVDLIKTTKYGTEMPGATSATSDSVASSSAVAAPATTLWISTLVLSVSGAAAAISVL